VFYELFLSFIVEHEFRLEKNFAQFVSSHRVITVQSQERHHLDLLDRDNLA